MPYTAIQKEIVDGKEQWCFRNKETGRKICSDTKEGAASAMRARYAFAQELKRIDPFFNPMIKTDED